MKRLILALGLAASATGCNLGTTGDLGRASFTYNCGTGSDAVCDGFISIGTTIPAAVAVGGHFQLAGNGTVTAAAPALVGAIGPDFVLLHQGDYAFFMRQSATGPVEDFVHVHATEIDHFEVSGDTAIQTVGPLDMQAGGSAYLSVVPVDVTGLTLAGGLTYTWATSDETVLTVEVSPGATNQATLRGMNAGSATLSIASNGIVTDIPVTVEAP